MRTHKPLYCAEEPASYTVYLLQDPRDGLIRYVGVTKRPLVVRLAAHIMDASRQNTMDVYVWIRALIAEERLPSIYAIDRVPYRIAFGAEDYWMWYYAWNDAPLLNRRKGTGADSYNHYLQWMDARAAADPHWLAKIGHRLP
jgi:hypothetical protein